MLVGLYTRPSDFLIVFLWVPLAIYLAFAQPAYAADTGFLSGSVFVDANGNDMVEPWESLVPGATVYVRSQADPTVEITTQTDQGGYYVMDEVPLGAYDVWASLDGQAMETILTVELAETNGQISLDVPISTTVGPVQGNTLFLPIVSTAG